MKTTSIAQTLGSVRSMLDASAENLQRLDDPSARKLDASMSADRIGPSGILRTSVSLSRNVNPLQEKAYIEQITVLEGKNTKTAFLTEVQSIIGGGDNPQKSRLVTVIDDFFQSAKLIESNNSPSMRQTFVDKAENISDTLTGASDKITELRLEADKTLRNEASNANNTIRSLFKLNNEMLRSTSSIKLHDQRDVLIRDLAQHFDIKVSYGNSGTVQVTSKISGELLVSSDAYAKFTYEGALSKDRIIGNEDLPALTISQFDKAGNTRRSTIFAGGSGDATKGFSGGKWSSLIELRDKTLVEIGGAIKTLTSNFTKQVNDAHNSGSPFPLKSFFESSIEVSGDQTMEWGEEFTIFAVDEIGSQLKGGAGKLNPMTINMQTLREAVGGTPTVAELIDELNEKLDTAPSRERAAMGAILGAGDVQIPGEYLLNNIQLKANSTVDAGNNHSFTFELDLQGNSHFGSTIEVLSVATVGGFNPQNVDFDDLPDYFLLGKDKNVATSQSITVEGAEANSVITVQIRVTGENGVVSTGSVSFNPNPPNRTIGINSRIAFESAVPVVGGFDHALDVPVPVLTSHSGVAKARLVDSNGNTVDPTSGQKGKLVIESNNPNYRMVFQGGNFGAEFGFNDLFKYDARTGGLEVTQAIVDDVNQLAIAQVQKNAGADVVHSVGDVQASGELVFAFDGGNLGVGDTVTVDGTTFTFAGAPAAGPLQVLVGGNDLASLTNLQNKINAHPAFNNRIVAAFDGVDTFKITALTRGSSGNDIQVATNLSISGGGDATASYVAAGGAPGVQQAVNPLSPLAGGTNKFATEKVFSYNLEPGSKQVFEKLSNLQSSLVSINAEGIVPEAVASLAGLATIVTGLLSDYVNESEIDSKVAATVLEQTDKLIKENSGIQREPEYLRALDLAQLMNALAHLLSMIQSSNTKTQDIIFG
ncbi:MAG: hypothetical protein NWS20_02615 [Rickettsiaceae bacterium]|nr:hypothetical protein [Rickettsiaceae bacterium]MDP4832529.1 hypothetical protein [Rickettsiaceae bacterium]MDP5020229.1 hypothetical protein [Rickettsiaceae bacterium]MDP5083502.1 hypothetical protein [Rickettsiaceae bacterium]